MKPLRYGFGFCDWERVLCAAAEDPAIAGNASR
jgi:hypothetical protein